MDESAQQDALFSTPAPAQAQHPAAPVEPKPRTKKDLAVDAAKALIAPWWAMYGKGWPQAYIVVVKVVAAALLNGMPEEQVKDALRVLGPERTPVSGGTMAFALRTHSRSAEAAVAVQSARRDPRHFTHEL